MKPWKAATALAGVLLLASACAHTGASRGPWHVDAVTVLNQAGQAVEDVSLFVPATGRRMQTNRVLPGAAFHVGFSDRAYRGAPLELSFLLNGSRVTASELAPRPGEGERSPVWKGLLTIHPGGAVSARLVPVEP